MNYRTLGKTGFEVSEVSLGTWQVGGTWGSGFDHDLAQDILKQSFDAGVNFIDTADVYEAGESEKAVGKFVNSVSDRIYVATKCGRQINPHVNEGYTPEALRGYVEDSLKRLNLETIDLIQLHCPPTEVYYRPEIFGEFERLKAEGKILNLGVSVEKVEEALKAIEYENVTTVQIIYNMFRQRPDDLFYERAKEKNVGVIVRVPLASGLLTGKYSLDTQFEEGDHRHGNRNGEWFDKGETFAGVPYEVGLNAVEKIKKLFPEKENLAQVAIKWILMNDNVSVVIPGASKSYQVDSNMAASALPELSEEQMSAIKEIYEEDIKPHVHHLW
ncbi:MAG TPA: aldo/keto reductase [Balneolaceae bacterium]|nr:aldo/keto reductase [Balneolaceae bacterium]|tara:strand:+ start:297245 stop:298231 length:987 start_codon:yes stop_codon:yes gene_type:complete